MTIEKLAYESDLGSKGHLSSLERGLVLPTIETIRVLAERLGVLPLDLLNVGGDGWRSEQSRKVSPKDAQTLFTKLKRKP